MRTLLEMIEATVERFDPARDKEPRYETYKVPYERFMTAMDVLDYIRDNFSNSLSYRWFCGVKKCGFCSVMVNGKPVLSCWEPASKKMRIEPLRNFPVAKDLVIDRSKYDTMMNEFKLQLVRKDPYPGFPEPLRHEDFEAAYHAWDCIECMVCMAACTVLRRQNFKDTPAFSGFMGPAPLVQLARYELDPRDSGDRFHLLFKGRIEDCGSCNDCTTACPKDIDVLVVGIDGLRAKIVKSGRYYIRGWNFIRRMPRSVRRLTKCTLHLSVGEGWKGERSEAPHKQ